MARVLAGTRKTCSLRQVGSWDALLGHFTPKLALFEIGFSYLGVRGWVGTLDMASSLGIVSQSSAFHRLGPEQDRP